MATAKKLPSGSWRVQVYAGKDAEGKRLYKSFTADTKKAAELAAAQYAAQEKKSAADSVTVGEAIKCYIDTKAAVLSPSTVLGYKRQARNCYLEIEQIQLDRLTQAVLQSWVSGFALGHSAKYVQNAWGLLHSAIEMYRPGFDVKITLPQRVRHKIEIPQIEEIRAYAQAVRGTALEVPFLLATQCGLRASEIAGLRKTDVDAQAGGISIRQARVTGEDGATVKAPKSYAGYRDLPCPKDLCEKALACGGVYVTELEANRISNEWSKFVRRNGLPLYGFHALRHYFASRAALAGVPKEYLVELMGHSSSRMLDQIYLHTFKAEKTHFARMIAEQVVIFHDDAT